MSAVETTGAAPTGRRRTLLFVIPVLVFAVVGVFLALGLTRDPSLLPSALVGKPAPDFDLPPIPGRDEAGFRRADLGGKPMLVNVFSSWCLPCRAEHPLVSKLAEEGVTVMGINYKDDPAAATAWLKELGDPFTKVGADRNGRTAIEWGVYGVPETFVIDKNGQIVHRQAGPLMPRDVEQTIKPLLARLSQ
ncbi:MAG: DsbE family thiol:disulfide interchange protein [Geminicoccaceae bacterium]